MNQNMTKMTNEEIDIRLNVLSILLPQEALEDLKKIGAQAKLANDSCQAQDEPTPPEYIYPLQSLEGLSVGQLSTEQLKLFNRMCEYGYARRSYEGMPGILGLAKVRLNR